MRAETVWCFGPFRLDPRNQVLWHGGQTFSLRPKAFAVLCHLVTHAGQLTTKADLFQAVWPEIVVSDAALTVCIRELRHALGDNPHSPQFIETVHTQGYRFVAPVQRVEGGAQLFPTQPACQLSPSLSSTSCLVERTAELEYLHRLLEKMLRGERQIVFVTGEPGIGKTALIDTFLAHATAAGTLWLGQGQSIAHHGVEEPYLPVLTALGQVCRGPGGERFLALLHQHAPSWLVQMPAVLSPVEITALQQQTLGVTRERMLRELAEAVEVLTREWPLVLWLEDLQWSDTATLDLVAFLARRRQPARLMLLGTYRPVEVIVSGHPLKGIKQELQFHSQCEELAVGGLTEAALAKYLAVRFPARQLPAELSRVLHERTEGNPLFLVNIVDHLVAQGVLEQVQGQWQLHGGLDAVATGIPETLRELIEAQFERLSPEDQQVLEAARVAGLEFSAAAVAAALKCNPLQVTERCAAVARRRQFLQFSGVGEWPDGTVAERYRFLHVLYQQVLYERAVACRRIELHQRIAERAAVGYGARANEIAAELALHFERGREYHRAVESLQHAGETATRRSAHQEAVRVLTKGLTLLQALPDASERTQHELTLQVALGVPLIATKGWGAPEVGQVYRRALELCHQVGETPRLFQALFGLWVFHYTRAELMTAQELAEQVLGLAQSAHEPGLLLEAHHALGNTLHRQGELVQARAHLEQGITLYDPRQHLTHTLRYGVDDGVTSLGYVAVVLWLLGYPDQAWERTHEMLSLGRDLAHPLSLAWALNAAALHAQLRLEGQVAQAHAEAELALCTAHGFAQLAAVGTIVHGWALIEQGQKVEGIAQISQGLAAHQTTGAEIGRPRYLAVLAEAYGTGGQAERGLNLLAEALAAAHRTGERFYEAELYRLRGVLLLAQKGKRTQAKGKSSKDAEAEECFQKAIEIARRQSAKSLELRAVISLSRLWQQQGKKEEARQLLAEIYGWFTEGFDTKDLQEAKSLLAELTERRSKNRYRNVPTLLLGWWSCFSDNLSHFVGCG